MIEFKVGDHVRRNSKEAIGSFVSEGTEGVVQDVRAGGLIIKVLGYDLSSYKFDLIMSASAQPPLTKKTRECPCGIYRGDCDYHRD